MEVLPIRKLSCGKDAEAVIDHRTVCPEVKMELILTLISVNIGIIINCDVDQDSPTSISWGPQDPGITQGNNCVIVYFQII